MPSDAGGNAATNARSASLVLDGVSKRFGHTDAMREVSLSVAAGEALVLLGPSGCGKTTTLRVIAGFERPDAGVLTLAGRVLVDGSQFVPAEKRGMGVVFQSYALWPHMTVGQNVGFGPKLSRGNAEVADLVHSALSQVHLGGYGDRYPHELSGGQQQRVALARALVIRPNVLLLDEPLSNLDAQLREDMRVEINALHHELAQTMVYVTHDQDEALSLADRIAVMNHGRIEQIGSPEELYRRPQTRFVAQALGAVNVLGGRRHASTSGETVVDVFAGSRLLANEPTTPAGDGAKATNVEVAIRPHAIDLSPASDDHPDVGVVTNALYLGDRVQYLVEVRGQRLRITQPGGVLYQMGDRVALQFKAGEATILETESERTPIDEVNSQTRGKQ